MGYSITTTNGTKYIVIFGETTASTTIIIEPMESLKEKPDFEQAKHTPLPWSERRFDGTFLQGPDAKLIVEACNNYYSLQKELTLAKEEIERQKIQLSNYAYQVDMAKRKRDKAELEIERLKQELKNK